MLIRTLICAVAGTVVTVALFWVMQALVTGGGLVYASRAEKAPMEFIRVQTAQALQVRERVPPPEPSAPPPPESALAPVDLPAATRPSPRSVNLGLPAVGLPMVGGSGPYLGRLGPVDPGLDGEVIPIVRVEPQWPRDALSRRIQGWVLLEFTILPDGSVADAEVIESVPERMFDRNALRALERWRFRPRVLDGRPVSRRARQRIDFRLFDEEEA
jgi:periplasmic protein TonB